MCYQPRFSGANRWRLIHALGEYRVQWGSYEVTKLGRLVLAGKRQ
jgi:hypothetical protein